MSEKKQVRLNLATNIANLLFSVIIGIVYTPYLVKTLGITAYGILPLALIINQYISVFTNSLTGSLTRFYSIALQKNDIKDASHYLSTAFLVIIILIAVISPAVYFLIIHINTIFNIPVGYVKSARLLFLFTILSFISSLFSSIFNISLYAYNKLDKINYIKIIRLLLKFILVIAFFEIFEINIIYIGYSNLIAELLVLAISFLLFKKVNPPGITIGWKYFDKIKLVSVLGMTIWVLLHQVGDTTLYRIDNILVNIFWSTKESGILAALSEFGGYVILVVTAISSIFGPLILISYAKEDHKMVEQLSLDNSLTVGIVSAIIVGVLIGFSKDIIYFWLGSFYIDYFRWFIIKLIAIPTFAASGIFAFTYRSWNKVRFPAIATIIIGLTNLTVTYCLFYFFRQNQNIITVGLLISCFLTVLQSYGLNAFWFGRIYRGNYYKVIKNFAIIVFVMGITSGISIATSYLINLQALIGVLFKMLLSGSASILITYFWILNSDQKKNIFQLIK